MSLPESMIGKPSALVLAATDAAFVNRVARAFNQSGWQVDMRHPRDVLRDTTQPGLMILETGDDVALLCQIVYHLYSLGSAKRTLPVIAILSEAAIQANPSVAAWTMAGKAAVLAVVPRTYDQIERRLVELASRITSIDSDPSMQ